MESRIARVCVLAAIVLAFAPRLALASPWGSGYGDPPGFCAAQSWLPSSYGSLVTDDPTVANNPEQGTFSGWHTDPGYDDWYGFWYGDFQGKPSDASGWIKIGTSHIGRAPLHWNFADWGWSVHGHVKQYIAYYNWTFGGQCGMGWYRRSWPAPYMADVVGNPVLDIYVDSAPPVDPRPRIAAVSPGSISFSWDPVADRGDGAGADYFAVGMGGYTSWLTVDSGPPVGRSDSSAPVIRTVAATPSDTACVFVVAADKLRNATAPQSICGRPAGSPPPPPPPPPRSIRVNPAPTGLAGVAAWFWLDPAPSPLTTYETVGGVDYKLVAQPDSADWDFDDGGAMKSSGFGVPYPAESAIQHRYDTQLEPGYLVSAGVRYSLSWWWRSGGNWSGPYPLGSQTVPARDLRYPVRQAQPELETAA